MTGFLSPSGRPSSKSVPSRAKGNDHERRLGNGNDASGHPDAHRNDHRRDLGGDRKSSTPVARGNGVARLLRGGNSWSRAMTMLKPQPPKHDLTEEDWKRLREATMRRFVKTIAY